MRVLYWAPRVLSIVFALFLSVFALDVFGEGYGFWETLLALLMHLVPTFVVVAALAVAWRWEGIGGVLLVALAALYVIVFWAPERWLAYLMISGPLALVGALYLANWLLHSRRGY